MTRYDRGRFPVKYNQNSKTASIFSLLFVFFILSFFDENFSTDKPPAIAATAPTTIKIMPPFVGLRAEIFSGFFD